MVKNILSIDVEEVFHGEYTRQYKGQNPTYRTPYNIPKIIEMLKDHGVKATFFIVGEIAEKYPEVVKMIREEGHEAAFHGWTHEPLWKLTPERFREEVKAFKKLHPDCIGFRAPSFSLNNKTKWVLKILHEEGFKYDSSIFPTWTPLYGMYKAPTHPYHLSLASIIEEDGNFSIIEFPLAVYKLFGLKVPIAGGFWLRLWNLGLIKRGVRKINEKGFPAVIYIHNWERARYSFLYVDDILSKNLDAYLSHYTHVILMSDPKTTIGSLLSWVSAGNSLVVLNTHGNGFFADLLGINNSSPLLSVRNCGLGKIAYINLEKVDRKSDVTKQELIREIGQALALDECFYKVNVLPVYNSTSGSIKIDGDLNLLTDVLKLQGSVTLTSSPFQLNESTEIGIYGKVTLTIENASLLISPSESYLAIKPESYPVEGEALIEGHNALIIVGKNVIYNLSTPLNFKFRSVNIYLNARLPLVNASGTITFDKLDVHEALYVPLAGIVQQKAKVEGKVKFDTTYISDPLIIFSMFKADGKILNLDALTISKPTIPWSEVLSSSYNLAFNIVFFSSIIFYAFKKRKAKQIVKEEGNGN